MRSIKKQEKMRVTVEDVYGGIRKISNQKASAPECIRGLYRRFTLLYVVTVVSLDFKIEAERESRSYSEYQTKVIVTSSYRPVACLLLM